VISLLSRVLDSLSQSFIDGFLRRDLDSNVLVVGEEVIDLKS
jgi:hypothetical protein